jgi:adenosylcobalamin-dependent ribonucleoside-diphosphate reductase
MIERELTKNAIKVLIERYFKKSDGEEIEDWSKLCRRVTQHVSSKNPRKAELEPQYYDLIHKRWFLPNSPTLFNAGTSKSTLSACFYINIPDTFVGIMETLMHGSLIQKWGGGMGYNFSDIRPAGDIVKTTNGKASGPISFMKMYSAAAKTVTQAGKRDAAQMALLSISHPDIEEFISCKRKEGELHNFNISVIFTDEFFTALKNNSDFDLKFGGRVYKTVKAKRLFELIVDSSWKNGEPGFIFIDNISKFDPLRDVPSYNISGCNPCGEQVLENYGSCNLGSIDLSKHVNYADGEYSIDYPGLANTVRLAVRFLDDVITVNDFPIEKIKETSLKGRKIGLGVMGWADLLFRLKIRYGSDESLELARKVMAFIQYFALYESNYLAQENGEFPLFKDADFSFIKNYGDQQGLDWDKLYDRIQTYGLRNATVSTIAPTGCIFPDTKISLLNGTEVSIKDLVRLKEFWVYSRDNKTNEIVPGRAHSCRKTGVNVLIIKVTLDNGEIIRCTPDHKFRLKSGRYKEAKDLLVTDSLSPLYRRLDNRGYEEVLQNSEWQSTHCMTYHWKYGLSIKKMEVAHHKDFNKKNNEPNNILAVNRNTHMKNPETVKRHVESRRAGAGYGQSFIMSNPMKDLETCKHAQRTKCVNDGIRCITLCNNLNRDDYNLVKGLRTLSWDKAVTTLFNFKINFKSEVFNEVSHQNHKIVSIENDGYSDVYDFEVDTHHNFAITAGIFIHNSLSILADTSGGIEPNFLLAYKKNVIGTTLYNINPVFNEMLLESGINQSIIDDIISKPLSEINLPEKVKEYFVCANDVSVEQHIKMQAAFQGYTSNAISKTINLPNDATRQDISKSILFANELSLKGLTIYRDGSRDKQVLEKIKGVRETPDFLTAKRVMINTPTGKGFLIVSELDGKPYEIYFFPPDKQSFDQREWGLNIALCRSIALSLQGERNFPEYAKQLRKAALFGNHPTLVYVAKSLSHVKSYESLLAIPHEDEDKLFLHSMYSILKLGFENENLSLLDFAEELDKCVKKFGSVTSIIFHLVRALRVVHEKIGDNGHCLITLKDVCPNCGEKMVLQEGCKLCLSCNYDKCG